MADLEQDQSETKEQLTEVRVFRAHLRCLRCNNGDYRQTGPTVDNKTPHTCTYCQHERQVEGEPYPHNKYRPTGHQYT